MSNKDMIKSLIRKIIELSPQTSLFLRTLRDQLDRNDPPIKTPWGFTLAGGWSMAMGDFEPSETQIIRHLLTEVDVLVNIGANVGYYCLHALSLGKPVIAAEPISRNLHYLLKNIRDNGWAKQAEIFPVALGQSIDILEIFGGGTGASLIKGWASIPESYVTQVPIITLDRLLGNALENRRSLILVDIEGAEYMLLKGALATLKHHPRPVWMVEISTTEHQPFGTTINPNFSSTFDMFLIHGYEAFTAEDSSQPVSEDLIKRVQVGEAKLKAHNFIFR